LSLFSSWMYGSENLSTWPLLRPIMNEFGPAAIAEIGSWV